MDIVIGADGFIGSRLLQKITNTNQNAIGTFFQENIKGGSVDLCEMDITSLKSLDRLKKISGLKRAFICVQSGNVKQCAEDPKGTRVINVAAVKNLLETLGGIGVKPIYISTSMVFSGETPDFYTEKDVPDPVTEYGRQKLEVEQYITNKFKVYTIARLTKVLNFLPLAGKKDIFYEWYLKMSQGKRISAFNDQFIQPLTLDDTVSFLQKLSEFNGTYHISGPETGSYYEFAVKMANRLGFDQGLVSRETAFKADEMPRANKYNYLSNALAAKTASFHPLNIENLWQR